ncbi:MAG: hypothetical protein EBU54_10560 [Mycobacteriaceae bacterium]|nr:hypothetical protein [Mycobacteriaceae bacterium]
MAMMAPLGWKIIEYGHTESHRATTHITLLTAKELASTDRPASSLFRQRVLNVLPVTVRDGDIICHLAGVDAEVAAITPRCHQVECGVAAHSTGVATHRIFVSTAWLHWHRGLGSFNTPLGPNYDFVAPDYYDPADWPVVPMAAAGSDAASDAYVLFFGDGDGLGRSFLAEVARQMPDTKFVAYGSAAIEGANIVSATSRQAAMTRQDPNAWHRGTRADLLGHATVLLATTMDGREVIEAQLCGTPVVASNYCAYELAIEEGRTGYRCATLAEYVQAIRLAAGLDRGYTARRARALYSLEAVGPQYNNALLQIAGLGWDKTVKALVASTKPRTWSAESAAPAEQRPKAPPAYSSEQYDEDFHRSILEEEAPQAAAIAKFICGYLCPGSVADYGASSGLYLKAVWDIAPELQLVGYEYALAAIKMRVWSNIVECDLTQEGSTDEGAPVISEFEAPPGAGAHASSRRQRVGICLEVLEHIDDVHWRTVLDNITRHCDVLIFSAALPGQGGVGHINCRPKSDWQKRFATLGWHIDLDLTTALVCTVQAVRHMGWLPRNVMCLTK